jgi:hypothetical protein
MAESQLKFHFIKTADCKEVLVDGAFGGITPRGRISMAVYTERLPIPQETVHSLTADVELGPEIQERRVTRENFVRLVESVLHFDIGAAKVIHDWLGQKISELEALGEVKK